MRKCDNMDKPTMLTETQYRILCELVEKTYYTFTAIQARYGIGSEDVSNTYNILKQSGVEVALKTDMKGGRYLEFIGDVATIDLEAYNPNSRPAVPEVESTDVSIVQPTPTDQPLTPGEVNERMLSVLTRMSGDLSALRETGLKDTRMEDNIERIIYSFQHVRVEYHPQISHLIVLIKEADGTGTDDSITRRLDEYIKLREKLVAEDMPLPKEYQDMICRAEDLIQRLELRNSRQVTLLNKMKEFVFKLEDCFSKIINIVSPMVDETPKPKVKPVENEYTSSGGYME